jgi:hypothetical protein
LAAWADAADVVDGAPDVVVEEGTVPVVPLPVAPLVVVAVVDELEQAVRASAPAITSTPAIHGRALMVAPIVDSVGFGTEGTPTPRRRSQERRYLPDRW